MYPNFFPLKLTKREIPLMEKAVKLYNSRYEYELFVLDQKQNSEGKDEIYIDMCFKTHEFKTSSINNYVLFDFAKCFRDIEIQELVNA